MTVCNELCELGKKYGTDKHNSVRFPVGGDLLSYYYELWKDRRMEVRKVLEIGIGHAISGLTGYMGEGYRPGASLFMWEEYFPNAEIYALDIVPEILVNRGRIRSFVCDQGCKDSLRQVVSQLGDGFDFIEDDGSHQPAHQILTARMFVPMLAPQGVYVIEDVNEALGPRAAISDGIPYKSSWREIINNEGLIGDLTLKIEHRE
jgi:hypothetical protein